MQLSQLLGEIVDRNEDWLFEEALVALSLDQDRHGQWPEELMDLLEGRVSIEDRLVSRSDSTVSLLLLVAYVWLESAEGISTFIAGTVGLYLDA